MSRANDREHITEESKQRALLVTLEGARADWEESLAEMERLAETAGVEVVGTFTQRRERPEGQLERRRRLRRRPRRAP